MQNQEDSYFTSCFRRMDLYAHLSPLNPSKCHAPSLIGAIEGFIEVNPYAKVRCSGQRARAHTHTRVSGQASRPAGVAEEEGTIRGQIKTRRVTVEWIRNERVCDFGHAVRLYVDLCSTQEEQRERERGGGSGEKETTGREKERETERRERGTEELREDSIYSAFVPSSSRLTERALRLASIRTRSLPSPERQTEERRRIHSRGKTKSEKERISEIAKAARARRRYVEEAEKSLFERPRAAIGIHRPPCIRR